jgi:hypothetical protein
MPFVRVIQSAAAASTQSPVPPQLEEFPYPGKVCVGLLSKQFGSEHFAAGTCGAVAGVGLALFEGVGELVGAGREALWRSFCIRSLVCSGCTYTWFL